MPQRPPQIQAAPAEVLSELNLGYNGFTDPHVTNPKMWAPGTANVFSGAFSNIQRARFANVKSLSPLTGLPLTSLKFFAIPGFSSYLLGDAAGKLFSFDTGASYTQTQRLNPYVDPAGAGSSQLNGPWSREVLQNIAYEMNGQVKQAGRLANAATIEGWGLDTPDATPQIVVSAGSSQTITAIARLNGVVTVTVSATINLAVGSFANVVGMTTDTSFNGTFAITSASPGGSPTTFTWNQPGQNSSPAAAGTLTNEISKSVGRSYAWAWENANKPHVSAPSPSTQFILFNNQFAASINLIEPGTVSILLTSPTTVTGTGTQFTPAWIGRSLWINNGANPSNLGRIVAVPSPTSLTLATATTAVATNVQFQVFDPQATHVRLYQTADGQATYFRTQRNAFNPNSSGIPSGLFFNDQGNSEPPSFPYTTETSQLNNVPPPIGQFVNEYQGRLCVYGVSGVPQTFFYSNQETTLIGQPQESFAPLNQISLPIANGKINGMLEFPGSMIIWSDKQDMFRLSGLLTDNTLQTAANQGASISRLPYNLGSASPFASDITPLGGIWLTSNAEIWLFTDRYAPRNIGRPVQDILNTIATANLSLARAKYYHTGTRNWFVLSVAANGAGFNNTLLVLDLDLLASNGSPSYFTFDMATNHPSWYVFTPGPVVGGVNVPRCDSLETVIEAGGAVRLLTGGVDRIQDVDYQGSPLFGTEIAVSPAPLILHAWGNDSAFMIKRPTFIRFTTNRPPSTLAADGWSFAVQGVDDDFYTFDAPLSLALTPGVNDTSSLCGNPNLASGAAFRHSPELYRIGGVNFVAGRRLKFQVNFPTAPGTVFQLTSIQVGSGANPPM